VNRAIDAVINKIVGLVRKLWAKLKPKKDRARRPSRRPPTKREEPRDRRSDKDKLRALDAALRDAGKLVEAGMPVEEIKRRLPPIERRYRLAELSVVVDRRERDHNVIHFVATINPSKKSRDEN
jgi:hypothetical protein